MGRDSVWSAPLSGAVKAAKQRSQRGKSQRMQKLLQGELEEPVEVPRFETSP
jgi:hypothetical protein